MSLKKVESILSLIEVAENNLKTARSLLQQMSQEKGIKITSEIPKGSINRSLEEQSALEVVEGYFDGENMIGDNGQIYLVPQNYASKTQLIIGDRMKWILTTSREVFKLIQPAARERVIGTFTIEGENYLVLVDGLTNPVKILKASATYAMKNLGLNVGDDVAIYIPKDATPTWGAFISVVKSTTVDGKPEQSEDHTINEVFESSPELDTLNDFNLNEELTGQKDYF